NLVGAGGWPAASTEGFAVLRQALLVASRSERVRRVVETAPFSDEVVRRFIAGETIEDALRVTGDLTAEGLLVTMDVLGEDTHDKERAEANVQHYVELLERLGAAGLGTRAEVFQQLDVVLRSEEHTSELQSREKLVCRLLLE